MRLPTQRHRVSASVRPDQKVDLRLAAPSVHDIQPLAVSVGLRGRAGYDAMACEKVVDLARHLDASVRKENEVVGDPLEFGQHVRGQQHRYAVVDRRRQHRGHEIVSGDRVEHRYRLIQHEQPRPPRQRQAQRELRLLASRQPGGLPL